MRIFYPHMFLYLLTGAQVKGSSEGQLFGCTPIARVCIRALFNGARGNAVLMAEFVTDNPNSGVFFSDTSRCHLEQQKATVTGVFFRTNLQSGYQAPHLIVRITISDHSLN